MITIYSIESSTFIDQELLKFILTIYPKQEYGRYTILPTNNFKSDQSPYGIQLINFLYNLAHQGYAYLQIILPIEDKEETKI